MNMQPLYWLAPGLAVTLAVGFGSDALAQTNPDNALDQVVRLYRNHSAIWETILQTYALRLFWLLAGIEFTWAAVRLALRGADFGEWLAEVVNQILFIGFFLTLLLNSADWAAAIVGSFREAANQASTASGGTGNITPSNIFDVGLQLANRILEQSSIWAPGDSLGLIISALVILICFALIAAFMILALVESYIVISAGVLLMGFGGSRWTKDYAIKIVVYAVSVGAKLFVLQLLVGLGEAMIQGWLATFETSTTDIFIMVGSAVVMLALTKSVPDMVQALINGTSVGSGSAITGATAAVGAATLGTAAVAVGAGAALGGAARLASVQAAASADPPSSVARAARLTGNTMKNLGGAAVEDIGRRLGGRAHHGTMGGRMADSLFQRARDASAELNKPQAPQPQQPQPPDANTIRPA